MRPPIDNSSVGSNDARRPSSPTAARHHGVNSRSAASPQHDNFESHRNPKEEGESTALDVIGKRGPLHHPSLSVTQCDEPSNQEEVQHDEAPSSVAPSFPRDDHPQHHHHHYLRRKSTRRYPAANVQRRPTRGPIQNPVQTSAIACGIAAGIAQAGLFNPYDRALYLSIKNHRPFLSRPNWTSPYTGFLQSLGNRALAGGLYYPLEHYFLRLLNRPNESSTGANLAAGALAGACNAVVLNPITVVKYRTWGYEAAAAAAATSSSSETAAESVATRGWFREAWYVLNSAKSPRPFYNGLASTLMRDVAFGGVYTGCRLQIQWYADLSPDNQWRGNLVSAGLATILASPFNYVRSVQYATSSRKLQPSTARVLRDLARHVVDESDGSWLHRLRILQVRLRVGWGTLRVAMGMSFAHAVYDALQKQVRPYS